MAKAKVNVTKNATLGFEAELWKAAEKMARLTAELQAQMAESQKLDAKICEG